MAEGDAVPAEEYKVLWTDGYDRETIADRVVQEHMTKAEADCLCEKLRTENTWSGDWWKVAPQDAHVWGGMGELI